MKLTKIIPKEIILKLSMYNWKRNE